ncbi:DNA replication/checkpoint protein [Pseudomassariella vexata]|uniref:DNA replication regulator SLD2 n=1 Tax=Pseudomassariella vexata TaxID=1141098 RepID=A0A1Y2E9H4_9PEZI|nr:DNA replication/checkpoint protein [Pseudomassariella vexata]ORY68199.1 DNA replication/checkpoint protein [Pseudomassariella vexata]
MPDLVEHQRVLSTMDESERQKYEAKSQELRADLKRFEGDWARRNDGKKPGREDIKQNPVIAQKYKRYNQVRDILSGKIAPPPTKDNTRARKRKSEEPTTHTLANRTRPAETPSRSQRKNTDLLDGPETPSLRKLFSPALPSSIGPTPQKDGRVLGLFDLLSENEESTPSKSQHEVPGDPSTRIQATPSKRKHAEIDEEDVIKPGRTPVSSSKRAMLDTFMTPLKNRDANLETGKTPTTVSRLQFATPSFLRRAPPPSLDPNGAFVSPAPLRLPRKPIVRGLSSVVASLRKMEEERLDEDLEALREMENDAGPAQTAQASKADDEIQAHDSQAEVPQLLGGFDDEGLYDSEPEKQVGRDGQPLRVYTKKGQKRTTRKVNMRPTRSKRPVQSMAEASDNEDDEVVPETQFDATKQNGEPPLDVASDSDFNGSADESADEGKTAKPKAKKPKKKQTKESEKKQGTINKAVKMVSAMAHQNFKKLKLKNNGAKGGPGFGSRFRRRR